MKACATWNGRQFWPSLYRDYMNKFMWIKCQDTGREGGEGVVGVKGSEKAMATTWDLLTPYSPWHYPTTTTTTTLSNNNYPKTPNVEKKLWKWGNFHISKRQSFPKEKQTKNKKKIHRKIEKWRIFPTSRENFIWQVTTTQTTQFEDAPRKTNRFSRRVKGCKRSSILFLNFPLNKIPIKLK